MITPIEGKLLIGDDIYITNATELPYSLGTPEITWQQKGIFHGGIDLVGWRNLTKRGGQYYIHGNPMELAIVAGDTTGKSPDGDIISFEKTIVKAESENKIVVSLIGKMTYFLTCSDRNGRFNCGQKTETAIFQDTEQIPRQIDATDSGITITKTNIMWLVLPIGLLTHIIIGKHTALTKMFLNIHDYYTLKIIVVYMICAGLKGVIFK